MEWRFYLNNPISNGYIKYLIIFDTQSFQNLLLHTTLLLQRNTCAASIDPLIFAELHILFKTAAAFLFIGSNGS